MVSAVVAIGFGASSTRGPLDNGEQNEFGHQVRSVLYHEGNIISEMYGESYSKGWGQERGAWFAVEFPVEKRDTIHAQLHTLAVAFGQDAIAITEGMVTLIGPGKVNEFTLDPA